MTTTTIVFMIMPIHITVTH